MEKYAPVLVPTLNRYNHFVSLINSLSKCTHANETELIIALDYPLKKDHWEGYNKIRDYLEHGIEGFGEITIIERKENYGIEGNVFRSINEVFEKHDSLIFSEDDNLFSEDFLAFVNKGLKLYRNKKNVFSISGYQYPISIPAHYEMDAYFWQGFSAWGVGIWKEKWEKVCFEREVALEDIRKLLRCFPDVYRLSKIANHYLTSNLLMLRRGRVSGDGRVCLYQYRNNAYSLFPSVSRVRNMGHDGSGTGCGYMKNDLYAVQQLYSGSEEHKYPYEVSGNDEINKLLYKHFKKPTSVMLMAIIGTLLYNAGIFPMIKKYSG